jgi:EAL domain-containing protein (putative c-di-GMP-specific phosphodiesterase class I)
MLEMLRAGASAYVVKGVSVGEIVETIQRTHRGQMSLSSEVASAVIDELVIQLEREDRDRELRINQVDRIVRVLKHELLTCVYQPIVDMRDGHIVGAEALARFPVEPARTPDVWFKEAEAVGLRDDLELAALRAALEGVARLPEGAYLTVNMSPRLAFSTEFHEIFRDVDPNRIVLEVAESMPVDDYEAFGNATAPMRARGFRLAIDDAGLGYSLHHILQLEPDLIKLDIALCKGINADHTRRALARALVGFAEQIGATIIAEGVEIQADADALMKLGVRLAQGFHYYRPGLLPIEERAELVRA